MSFWTLIVPLVLALVAAGAPGPAQAGREPYAYSAVPCPGCWYGEWQGRFGWHHGGGEPWTRAHWSYAHQVRGQRFPSHGASSWHQGHKPFKLRK